MKILWLPLLLLCLPSLGCDDDDDVPIYQSERADAAVQATWDGTFAEPVARPEHPRPDFRRETFINLNTRWAFAWDPDDLGVSDRWFERDDVFTERIQVPYAWEAPLGGLTDAANPYAPTTTMRALTYRGVAWYRLQLPAQLPRRLPEGDDWHIVFGAVDFDATVWIDGTEVVRHTGGFTPFSANLSAVATGEAPPVIVVRVEDKTELNDRAQPVGKQGGSWYTRVSGIWQTVYLEQRPEAHLTALRIVPDVNSGAVTARWDGGEATIIARLNGEPVGQATGESPLTIALSEVLRWSPEYPTRYALEVRLNSGDVVHSTFGLAQAGTDWIPGRSPQDTDDPNEQAKAFTLNGQPVYLRCVLDQSWWPGGLFTAPSVEAIRADLEFAKELGFNCIRLHIKPDEPVKLDLLDELGFLVVYDMPGLDMAAANTPNFIGRRYFEETMREVMARDANHPSLVMWGVFNENWGLSANGSLLEPTPLADDPSIQQWVREMVELAQAIDPTRPVEDNSAGGIVEVFEHLTGDANSFHYYTNEPEVWRQVLETQAAATYPGSPENYVGGAVQDGDVWWNSEFAAFSFLGDASMAICDLWPAFNELRRQPKLAGYVLTQLTDVEYEMNGLMTYERGPKDLCAHHGVSLSDLLREDFIGFEWLPGHTIPASTEVNVPLWFSLWRITASAHTVNIRWDDGPTTSARMAQAQTWQVTPIENVQLTTPSEPGEHILVVEVVDNSGRICANRLPVMVE